MTPDIGKHLRDVMGSLAMELATAKAVIEAQSAELDELKKSLAEAKADKPDGARGADEPVTGS